MSTLILQLPARLRHPGAPVAAEAAATDSADPSQLAAAALRERIGDELTYVLTPDGITAQRHDACVPALLPRAAHVVAVVAATDVSWHRITVPKASGARLRAALGGLLEEALLDDVTEAHMALEPQAKAGEQAWVAVCRRDHLASRLQQIEKAGLRVDRVVPAVWPDDPPSGYFETGEAHPDDPAPVQLTWSTREGVASWPIKGGAARAMLPEPLPPSARFFATPAVAAPAERWLGGPVTLQTEAEHLMQAARSLWDLRQFDLAPSSRGLGVLNDYRRRFMGPSWRPVRLGLGVLLAVQLLGLNLWAWERHAELRDKQQAMTGLLRSAHPDVQAVLDAPAQMRRANEALRAAAGRAGDSDLEQLLQVAASAWPLGQPVQGLQYEGGRLTLAVPDWRPDQIDQFRAALEPAGWRVEALEGRLTLARRT